MDIFAPLTSTDFAFLLCLVCVALLMWWGRAAVAIMLLFLPAVLSILGIAGAVAMYGLGRSMHWDSPGSPGILLVMIALIISVIFAVTGIVSLIMQIRRWRRPKPARTQVLVEKQKGFRVGLAIAAVLYALFSVYRYARSHQDSHSSEVQQLAFSDDGGALYSLDQQGILKKWNLSRNFEQKKWILSEGGTANKILVSGDEKQALILRDGKLTGWSLDGRPQIFFQTEGVLAIDGLDLESFLILKKNQIEWLSYADTLHPRLIGPFENPALSFAALGTDRLAIGFESGALELFKLAPPGITKIEKPVPMPPDLVPRKIRASPAGQYVAIFDSDDKFFVMDLKAAKFSQTPQMFASPVFEVTDQGQLLLARASDLIGFDIQQNSSYPLFNHGGSVVALAISDRGEGIAIGIGNNIFIKNDHHYSSADDVRLIGRLNLLKE